MGKFIRLELLTVSDEELVQIDFINPENQLEANQLFIGFTTKQVLNRLWLLIQLNRGKLKNSMQELEISTWQLYHICSKHFPLGHEVLYHASFCNFELRMEADISSIEFFIKRYPVFFASLNLDLCPCLYEPVCCILCHIVCIPPLYESIQTLIGFWGMYCFRVDLWCA